MKRNTVTMLKYIGGAACILFFGPHLLKSIVGKNDDGPRYNRGALPMDPEELDKRAADAVQIAKEAAKLPKIPSLGMRDLVQRDGRVAELGDAIQHHAGIGVPDANGLKDWHDWEAIAREEQRTGPGEQGAAVILTPEEEKEKDTLYRVNGFNALANEKMSLNRAIKDIRHSECKTQKYRAKLPTVSVVVPFHNEHWTSLLRTAVSVYNRSPPELLKEIILADDASTKDFLGHKLDEHLASNYGGKVKVVRAKKREGLIRTRLLGAKAATGDVLIFLDSHCEANVNFLPPLLDPIAENSKTVVCPFIDVLDFENFQYRAQDEGARGAFDWEFFYKRLPITEEDRKHPSRPFDSPVMAGGLFAIDRAFFWELGGYDPGLDIWGGEQYELSFKIWQCHGRMVDAPCSRIGHVYRKFAPFPNPGIGDFVGKNYRRVAEVWMDEYAEFLYKRRPHYRDIDTGDISEQIAIREKLNCKSFKWFMDEVAFDLKDYYPPVEPEPYASGELKSEGTDLCVDTKHRGQSERFGLSTCLSVDPSVGGEQQFDLSWHKDLRVHGRTMCWDVSTSEDHAPIVIFNCHGMKGNQFWKYNLKTHQLYHQVSNQCVDCNRETKELYMSHCDESISTQKWLFTKMDNAAVAELWKEVLH
ncbi:putative polypeptide N-acetylgalactosaminyltransferase 10 [Watersipora subatra]|uniref:putative polypeptide N-acetylgalactosaminyltransferase 10 n=1 Tax=Watersipora subatra TaxID=2589382 RepID=UPI00355B213D